MDRLPLIGEKVADWGMRILILVGQGRGLRLPALLVSTHNRLGKSQRDRLTILAAIAKTSCGGFGGERKSGVRLRSMNHVAVCAQTS